MQNGYQSTNSWIIEEMAIANLGDARLNHRVGNVSFRQLCVTFPIPN